MSDKCPYCGAVQSGLVNWMDGPGKWFDCETYISPINIFRKTKCYERQIAQLQTAVDEARLVIKECWIEGGYLITKEWLAKYNNTRG